jgi:hypothetical protein
VADDVDMTQEKSEALARFNLEQVRYAAQRMPPGQPGECELCGEWSGRLVSGACAPCRDRHGLP